MSSYQNLFSTRNRQKTHYPVVLFPISLKLMLVTDEMADAIRNMTRTECLLLSLGDFV